MYLWWKDDSMLGKGRGLLLICELGKLFGSCHVNTGVLLQMDIHRHSHANDKLVTVWWQNQGICQKVEWLVHKITGDNVGLTHSFSFLNSLIFFFSLTGEMLYWVTIEVLQETLLKIQQTVYNEETRKNQICTMNFFPV